MEGHVNYINFMNCGSGMFLGDLIMIVKCLRGDFFALKL